MANKTIELHYIGIFGKGEFGDDITWDYELTDEQQVAYERAKANPEIDDPYDVPELAEIPELVYDEIKDAEMLILETEADDEYALECLGLNEMDPDELNDLVHSGDAHALEFFGLEGRSMEELEEWDAEFDLDELPTVRDFDADFEPELPFRLSISLPDDLLED